MGKASCLAGHPRWLVNGLLPAVILLSLCLGTAGTADAWLAVKVGGQFAGSLGTSKDVEVLGITVPLAGDSEPVESGWSLAVEGDIPLGNHFAVGGGVQYMGNRALTGDRFSGSFSFLPVYGQAQALLTGKGSKFRPYVKVQLGYNWFFSTDAFDRTVSGAWEQLKDLVDSSTNGGLYWSAGLGTYLFKYLLVEVMYMECRGNYSFIDSSFVRADADGAYRSVAVYAGVHF